MRLGLGSPADLIVRNAAIYTLDFREPWAEALAVRNGTILAVGKTADVGPDDWIVGGIINSEVFGTLGKPESVAGTR